jgi:hypothetical protein
MPVRRRVQTKAVSILEALDAVETALRDVHLYDVRSTDGGLDFLRTRRTFQSASVWFNIPRGRVTAELHEGRIILSFRISSFDVWFLPLMIAVPWAVSVIFTQHSIADLTEVAAQILAVEAIGVVWGYTSIFVRFGHFLSESARPEYKGRRRHPLAPKN